MMRRALAVLLLLSGSAFAQSSGPSTPTGPAGSPNPRVVSVQGIASATPVITNLTQVGGASVTLGSKTSANSIPVVIASDQAAVAVNGTVTANIGTAGGLALDTSVNGLLVGQGSTTSGQKGPLVQCAVTTSAPTYTTAQTSPISCDTSGSFRVTSGVPQGSTTSGQTGALIMGAVTTSPPSYTNGQTSPLSLTLLGSLRTSIAESLPSGSSVIGGVTISGTASTQDLADGSVSGGTAGSKSLLGGIVYNTSLPSLTNGQQVARQSDPQGYALASIQHNNVAFTDKSGTVATGGTSQQADAAATTMRVYLSIENPCTAATQNTSSTESIYVNFGASATSGGTSYEFGACGGYAWEMGYIPQGTINVTAPSTGHRYTIKVAEY